MAVETGTAAALNNEESLGRRLALVSICAGAALAAAKILIGARANSAAVLSDGLEASGDVLSSLVVFIGLRLASKPPDDEHPYGHGRYETLSGLAVGALLQLAGAAILWHGITGTENGDVLQPYALYPLLASVVVKIALALSKFRVGKRIGSISLVADGWHDLSDLLSTGIAMVAVLLTILDRVRFGNADRIGSIVIGILILLLSVRVVWQTVEQLLDTMPPANKMEEIRSSALSVPGALAIEKCFARHTGMKYHVDLHLEVDPEMTVQKSHEIATEVRSAIRRDLPWVADVLVHVEPSRAAIATAGKMLVKRKRGK